MARILVVEDAPDFRLMMHEILRSGGHDVVLAANGFAAIQEIGAGEFDLLVTDVLMPRWDGIELIRALARRGRHLPIIAVSGGGPELPAAVSLALTEAAGAHRTLYKPFRAAELLGTVDQLLAGNG